MSEVLIEFMVFMSLIGYCFVIANSLIGLSNIRDLNNMKGDIPLIKFHKWYGRIEIIIFYVAMILCLIMLDSYIKSNNPYLFTPSGLWAHTWIGGFGALVLITIKIIIAKFKKDEIYKYGHIIGPLGVIGWSMSYWTSIYNYYDAKIYIYPITLGLVPDSFLWTALIPFLGGTCLFLISLFRRTIFGRPEKMRNLHGVSMILHGITFGYEGSAKELVGTPVLYKYVFPKTYEFLERYAEKIGLNL
ncbi:MAG: hypothetical protein ACFFBF_15895 [Promethearchaeota archaeon]